MRTPAAAQRTPLDDIPLALQHLVLKADVLISGGQVSEGLDLLQNVFDTCRTAHGLAHPSTVAALDIASTVLMQCGQLPAAADVLAQLLDARTQLLGAEHHDTLMAARDLGAILIALEQYADGVDILEATLGAMERSLGPEDLIYTLQTKSNYAHGLRKLGRLEDACELQRAALADLAACSAPSKGSTAENFKGNLAGRLHDMGQYTEALQLVDELIAVRSRRLGCDHPTTLATKHSRALTLAAMGRAGEARKVAEEVVKARQRVLGPDNPETRDIAQFLAELAPTGYGAAGGSADSSKPKDQRSLLSAALGKLLRRSK